MRRFTDVCERNTKYAISYEKVSLLCPLLLLLLSICFTLNIFYFRIQSVCVCKTGIYFAFAFVFAFDSIVSRKMYIIMYFFCYWLCAVAVAAGTAAECDSTTLHTHKKRIYLLNALTFKMRLTHKVLSCCFVVSSCFMFFSFHSHCAICSYVIITTIHTSVYVVRIHVISVNCRH